MNLPEINRSLKIIKQSIEILKLDLSQLNILTEAGSGAFVYTPVIALMAGAEKVFVWIKDSAYGNADDIENMCKSILQYAGISDSRINFSLNETCLEHIADAHIITNSGHLRPLNRIFLQHVNPSKTVIPLMYEKWELRKSDIDIDYCIEKKIRVAGTWENHPDLKIFDYCEELILKIVFEAGYEIAQNKIIVWSSDQFGTLAQNGLQKLGAEPVILTTDINVLFKNAADADFILFCDYLSEKNLMGTECEIDCIALSKINPSIGIVHLCGAIDNIYVKENGLKIYPDKKGSSVRMTFTLAHLGMKPVLNLITAGLKVGEELYKNNHSELVQLIN